MSGGCTKITKIPNPHPAEINGNIAEIDYHELIEPEYELNCKYKKNFGGGGGLQDETSQKKIKVMNLPEFPRKIACKRYRSTAVVVVGSGWEPEYS